MRVEIGQVYENKTSKLLLPCLESFGNPFLKFYNKLFKMAAGIHDTLLDNSPLIEGRNLFIMFDSGFNSVTFRKFLLWLKKQDCYVADYEDGERKHMIVINVPKEHEKSYDYFLKGLYSKMYSEEFKKEQFLDKDLQTAYNILVKDPLFIPGLSRKIEAQFGDSPEIEELEGCEIDLPLRREEEIFNCKPNQRPFFNEELDKVWQN